MPLDAALLLVNQHVPNQLNQLVRYLNLRLIGETDAQPKELLSAELVFIRELAIYHPIQRHSQRVNIALISIPLFKPDLWRGSNEGSIVLLIKLLGPFEELPAQPEISDLEYAIIDEYILWFYIPMYDVELVEVLEGVKDLLEVPQDILLPRQLFIVVQLREIRSEVLIVAVL